MAVFDEKVRTQLKDVLSKLKEKVNILFFTQEIECGTCTDAKSFLEEVAELSDNLNLSVFDFQKDKEKADNYKVDKIPAILLLDNKENDTGIKFYGIPAGYEVNSFVSSLLEVSGIKEPLPPDVASRISNIKKDVHIQVFVSLT